MILHSVRHWIMAVRSASDGKNLSWSGGSAFLYTKGIQHNPQIANGCWQAPPIKGGVISGIPGSGSHGEQGKWSSFRQEFLNFSFSLKGF